MDNNDESNIKKILREMPEIKDSRSKEEVFARLKEDERVQYSSKKSSKRKSQLSWFPAVVTIAALLLLTLLIPSMLNGTGSSDKASEMAAMTQSEKNMAKSADVDDSAAESDVSTANEVGEEESSEIEIYKANDEKSADHFALYPNDVGDHIVFHMGLAGDAAASVPVTFLVPKSQIEEDFGEVEPSSFDLYEKYAERIDEEALGFSDYHPYKGRLSVEGSTLVQTLPKGHGYDTSSGTMDTHSGTLQDTFYGFKEIKFKNEDGTTVEFDQVGEPSKPLQLTSGKNHFNYYLFKQENGQEYLSSNFRDSYETLDVALKEMKVTSNDIYSSVIPSNVNYEVVINKDLTIIKFEEPLDLQAMDPKKAVQMIDGMLLTAASFGEQLKFENIKQTEWNGMNFREPLPKPVGPNLLPFLLK